MRLTRNYHFALVGCALVASALVLFATQLYGSGLSPDSVGYISTARSVMQGRGVNHFTGAPLVVLAPLYSIVLGSVAWLAQIDPLRLAPWLNAILLGWIVYASGCVAFKFIKAPGFAFAATAAILFSPTLLLVAVMAWSETLFIALTVSALWLAKVYLDAPRTRTLVFLAVALAFAMLTRYAGIVFGAWGVGVVLFAPGAPRGKKILQALLFSAIATLPLGLWALRNVLVSGTAFGGRPASIFSLVQNLDFTFNTIKLWFFPAVFLARPEVSFLLGIGVGFFCGAVLVENFAAFKKFLRDSSPLGAFTLLYLGWLILLATTTAFDRIGERLLAPIVVPLFILTFGFIEMGASSWRAAVSPRVVAITFTFAILLWLVFAAQQTISYALRARENGEQYTSQVWRTSPTLAYVRAQALPNDCVLVSNNPSALYLLANLVASSTPPKARYNSPEVVTADIAALRGKWFRGDAACLIWFNNGNPAIFFTPQELQTIAEMRALASFDDGAIYFVKHK